MDDAFCGGGDANEGLSSTAIPIQASAINMIKAAIFMGDPRYVYGLVPYQVGTCRASGVRHLESYYAHHLTSPQFAPRPSGFSCPNAAKIQSYCDAADPYCCNGNDANTHQGYGTEYGQAALTFINSKLAAAGTSPTSSSSVPVGTTTTVPPTSTPTGTGAVQQKYGQCGGIGWTGPTVCAAGSTCQVSNSYYSQCL